MKNKQNKPTESKAREFGIIYPFYTTEEIRRLIGYKSQYGARSFLIKLGIPFHMIGKKYIYYLSDIQTQAPELFASILEANNLNALISRPIDEETFITEQFK